MVIEPMYPARSSWVSTTTLSSGSTARTTPRELQVRWAPPTICWRRARSSSWPSRAASRPQARYPKSRPTPSARLTSRTTRQSRMTALVYVLVGWRPGGRFLVEEEDLIHQGLQIVPAAAGGARQPARAHVALAVEQELDVDRRGGARRELAWTQAASEQRVRRRDVGSAVGDHRKEQGRPAAEPPDDVRGVAQRHRDDLGAGRLQRVVGLGELDEPGPRLGQGEEHEVHHPAVAQLLQAARRGGPHRDGEIGRDEPRPVGLHQRRQLTRALTRGQGA